MIKRLLFFFATVLALAGSGALNAASFTYNSSHPPLPILDNTTLNAPLLVPDSIILSDVNVQIDITHTFDADLDIFLVNPAGVSVELSTDNGNFGDNYFDTIFDQQAATPITAGSAPFRGTFRPEGNLDIFNGSNAQGTWFLRVTDDAPADTGTLRDWNLRFEGEAAGVIPEPESWALLIAGLGLLGFTARRRHKPAHGH
jgi:subtilisin-like proprotein convertase family protein